MGSLQLDSRSHRSGQGSRLQGLDIQCLCTACDVLRDGNLARQQDNRQSDRNYASCTGEMSSEDKPLSAIARSPTKLGAGEVTISRFAAVREEVQISLGRTPASTKGRWMESPCHRMAPGRP
ncbi:unnamed protein product [Heligmosomoides polygyrus]|uniref:Uncharacterized protein n=1 Tax=Heligmosomoides polygyrus TaxID=6339 RepID=A0A183GR73_HELPZ|nr:unnamed protein product [Heligmosomoides polygyrus]